MQKGFFLLLSIKLVVNDDNCLLNSVQQKTCQAYHEFQLRDAWTNSPQLTVLHDNFLIITTLPTKCSQS